MAKLFYLTVALLCCTSGYLPGQINRQLSPETQASLLTAGPGEEMYSFFGHSAIRIHDPVSGLDKVYDYGIFDFDQPNFYLKFCQGKLLYTVEGGPFRAFMRNYVEEKRSITEQVLNCTPEECARLYNLLETNLLPENKDYKYDFFYDNCSTRLRDKLSETFAYSFVFDSSAIWPGATMRRLLRPYLTEHEWVNFGMDLILGIPTDKKAQATQFMFLPEYLHQMAGKTSLLPPDKRPIVLSEKNLLPGAEKEDPTGLSLLSPMVVMSFIAIIGVLSMFNARAERIFDRIFWLALGLAGLLIALLWFATDHQATKNNLNLFWAWPTHLLVFWRNTRTTFLENYFMLAGAAAGLILLGWTFLPQELPFAAFPIVALVMVKGLRHRFKEPEIA